jgi:hypothetical protein
MKTENFSLSGVSFTSKMDEFTHEKLHCVLVNFSEKLKIFLDYFPLAHSFGDGGA